MLANIRNQFVNFWQRITSTQRILLITGIAILAIIVPGIFSIANQTSYSVAFSGLSEQDAGKIVEKLQTDGTAYQIRGGNTILVPSDKVYEVRLSMARDGLLPTGGTVGFEVFSGNTLGMTEFTQKVNYQRALEGELERTIASLDAVQAVRVHIVQPEKALLTSEQMPPTASITIQEKVSSRLDTAQVRAITYLVANAVEGMRPEHVVLVDTSGNLLAAGSADGSEGAGAIAQVDGRRSAELSVAANIQKKVRNLLDTTLGPNKSVVQASVSLLWMDQEITTQRFDPTPISVRSQQTISESYTYGTDYVGGIPGAASNLPTPNPLAVSTSTSPTLYQRNEETTNYEITKVETIQKIPPGDIQLISLSVLVDGIADPDQLTTLENAIAAAAGISRTRGDQLSVQTLTFDRTSTQKQEEVLVSSERTQLYMQIGQIVVAVIVVILLLWYVAKLLKNLRMASQQAWDPILKPLSQLNLQTQAQAMQLSAGGYPAGMAAAALSEAAQPEPEPAPEPPPPPPRPKYKAPVVSPDEQKLQGLIQRMSEDNPASVAEIIQMWMAQDRKGG